MLQALLEHEQNPVEAGNILYTLNWLSEGRGGITGVISAGASTPFRIRRPVESDGTLERSRHGQIWRLGLLSPTPWRQSALSHTGSSAAKKIQELWATGPYSRPIRTAGASTSPA